MATSFAPNEVLQVRFFSQAQDQLGINIVHFRVISVTNQYATNQVAADDMSNEFAGLFVSCLGNGAKYYGLSLSVKVGGSWLQLATSVAGQASGAGSGDLLPRQASGIGTLTTGMVGRAGRGRIYIPFPSEGFNTSDGHPTGPYVAALQGLISNLGIDITIETAFPLLGSMVIHGCIYHRLGGTNDLISGWTARTRWATQRRRGDYGKPNTPPF